MRFTLEAGFLIGLAVVAALADLGPLAIVLAMGGAWVVVALVERSARSVTREGKPVPVDVPAPRPAPGPRQAEARQAYFSARRRAAESVEAADGWNLWELERRAREHAGADAVPEEWAATFRHLREFANSHGQLPSQFDSFVRESFPELTGR